MDKAIRRFGLLPPGTHVLCALSGGADSVCLTHLLATRAEELGITVTAAHFSHGLRPESADGERLLCRELCERLSIPLICGQGDTPAYARAHRMGAEEAARAVRWQFLEQAARDCGAHTVATGHHLEDSAETLLLNLMRGTGGKGLQGIPPKSGGRVRPLILLTKREILDYVAAHGLACAQDPTNLTGDNARARLRRQVLPLMEEMNPAALRHMAQTALDNWLRDEGLRAETDRLTACFSVEGQEAVIPTARLLEASPEAAVRALQWAQKQVGGRMLERPHLQALLALCRGSDPSARAHLPGTRALRRYDSLCITGKRAAAPPAALTLAPEEQAEFGPWQVCLTRTGEEGMALTLYPEDLPLTLRSRRPGDGIARPFGTKRLKELLMEHKIPREDRESIPILCSPQELLAVCGLCTAHRIKKEGGTTYRLICRRKEK